MRTTLTIFNFCLGFLVIGCNLNDDPKPNSIETVNYGDSLTVETKTYKDSSIVSHIWRLPKGDSLGKRSIYSKTPLSLKADTTQFYFTREQYRIYFPNNEVMNFCDSILKSISANGYQDELITFEETASIEKLKSYAILNAPVTEERHDWMAMLLKRFTPFVKNKNKIDQSNFISIEKFTSHAWQGDIYKLVSGADTVILGVEQKYSAPLIRETQ